MWKVLAESNDIISVEKKGKATKVRIEARRNPKNKWDVFKIYVHDDSTNVVNEYSTSTRVEAQSLITKLKREKDLSLSELRSLKSMETKAMMLRMKRIYKEYEVEKWEFSLYNEKLNNAMIIRYAEKISMDIILHERYRTIVDRLLKELYAVMGLKEFSTDVEYNIFIYGAEMKKNEKNNRSMLFGKLEMEFS